MDFFTHQARARRRSAWLTAAFLGTAALTVATVALLAGVGAAWLGPLAGAPAMPLGQVPMRVYVIAGGMTALGVAIATLMRLHALRGGGGALARMAGARPLDPEGPDPAERRLRNVSEEMAIAAGVPAPALYVMEREGAINAFAAGHHVRDAAIVVTAGALGHLDRDELQGVVAHEFSHIVHGDMRLNLRLIGLLGGLEAIGELGLWLMREAFGGRDRRGGGILAFVAGLGLVMVGSGGVLAGRLVRAAIAREREFLADASAVAFTRSRHGIGGALQRIRTQGVTPLNTRHGAALSHMLFGGDGPVGAFAWLDSHPPLERRIERIYGVSDVRFAPHPAPRPEDTAAPPPVRPAGFATRAHDAIGSFDAAGMAAAQALLARVPDGLHGAVRHGERMTALAVALLLPAGSQGGPAGAFDALEAAFDADMPARIVRYRALLDQAPEPAHLPLLELGLPTLASLTRAQAAVLADTLLGLIRADDHTSQLEYLLYCLVWRALPRPGRRARHGRALPIETLGPQCQLVVSCVAAAGADAQAGFDAGWALTGLPPAAPIAGSLIAPDTLARALDEAAHLRPAHLARLVRACAQAAAPTGTPDAAAAQALRRVCAALDVPLPLLLPADVGDAAATPGAISGPAASIAPPPVVAPADPAPAAAPVTSADGSTA